MAPSQVLGVMFALPDAAGAALGIVHPTAVVRVEVFTDQTQYAPAGVGKQTPNDSGRLLAWAFGC